MVYGYPKNRIGVNINKSKCINNPKKYLKTKKCAALNIKIMGKTTINCLF